MIITLTANPSLDRTITLEGPLLAGEVQAAASEREDAGGKGINVTRVVSAAGIASRAVLPLAIDDPFDTALRAARVETVRIEIAGRARSNVTIADPAGVTTKLNLPGATLTEAEASAIVDAVVRESAGAHWLVLAGSLPPGAGDDFYVRVIDAVRGTQGTDAPLIAVDTSGAALTAVVERGAPDLIKPNDEELADLVGAPIDGAEDGLAQRVLEAARALVPARVRAALVTLGAQGAVLITADGAWAATPPKIRVRSTVGAGDSSLAGYLLAESEGADPAERLSRSIRYGAAAASLPGTQAPAPENLPAGDVTVTRLE
ncbi:1-phosphofructokinase family hexose kinase [Microbacterium lacus]|uniref:1-phosphofructokinase family hexose kinase n=1 Tax=Microbacterium lacus TaxID=415217 RepID=UPI00384FFB96